MTQTKKRKPRDPAKHEEREKLFAQEYVKHFVAQRAYQAIYPNAKEGTANSGGSEYMSRPSVKAEIEKLLEERKNLSMIDSLYVVNKLHSIVEADYLSNIQYLTKEQFSRMTPEMRRLVQDVKIIKNKNTTVTDTKEYSSESETFKVTFMSKDKALELLGRHLGTFAKDNESKVDVTVKGFSKVIAELDI